MDGPLETRMTENKPATSHRILVVDDEATARSALTELLREEGFEVRSAADGFKALGQLDDWTPDLLLTDVKMPGMDGIELMRAVREKHGDLPVVVMTAFGSVEHAVSAMQQGANDYLTKPLNFPELLIVVRNVLAGFELRRENARLREALENTPDGADLRWIGSSGPSRELVQLVRQVADSDASALIVGEPGTGKEQVARALHAWGRRRSAPFVVFHCASVDATVLEQELFGQDATPGRIHEAAGGTLFFDEIAELPMAIQAKLVTQMQELRATGDVPAVRIVAATSRDLEKAVRDGRFREDLYYRLNVITLRVPTLRQRREDIAELAQHFLVRFARQHRKPIRGFTDRALKVLMAYSWPGNVRQLENCVERAAVLCNGPEIEPRMLPRELMGQRAGRDMPQVPGATLAELERYAILSTLEHVRGSTSRAAEMLGISPRKIQYRLAEYREGAEESESKS
jgi:two-component system response regulator HydG